MSLSTIARFVVGLILTIVGLGLVLGAVGIEFLGVSIGSEVLDLIAGIVMIAVGLYLLSGGKISLAE